MMEEDVSYVEQYFDITSTMLDAEGIIETKTTLCRMGWWSTATLEDVLDLLYLPNNGGHLLCA